MALLFGTTPGQIWRNRYTDLFGGISTIKRGKWGVYYNFNEAARLAYPTLSEFEIALLRIDIQERLAKRSMKEG